MDTNIYQRLPTLTNSKGPRDRISVYGGSNAEHSYVVRPDGTVWGAGRNGYGELAVARGDATNRRVFVQAKDVTGNFITGKRGGHHGVDDLHTQIHTRCRRENHTFACTLFPLRAHTR